jgi:hypothetical protein
LGGRIVGAMRGRYPRRPCNELQVVPGAIEAGRLTRVLLAVDPVQEYAAQFPHTVPRTSFFS